jgi:hypothetical protein
MAHSHSSAAKVQAAERRLQALELRKKGQTFAQIGKALGCSEQRAHFIVTQELQRLNRVRAEAAAEVARLEAERLDGLHAAFWDKAVGGDVDAANVIIKLANRRARLLGLDQPTSVNVNRAGAAPPAILEEVVNAPNATDTEPAAAPGPVDGGAGSLPPV